MESLPKIVAITGRKRNGKDTTADYLCKKYGYTKITLSEPVKDICRLVFNLDYEQLYGEKKEEIDERWGVSPRVIMQFVGTDMFRKKLTEIIKDGDKIWLKVLFNKINENPDKIFVISDLRFQNEIDYLKNMKDIKILRIKRNNIENLDVHESEKMIDNLEGINEDISNDGTLEELYKKIDYLFQEK